MPLQLRLILYPLFACFCLVVFSFVLFPFDSLKNRIQGEIEQGLGSGVRVTIGKVAPALFTGVVLKNVKIQPKDQAGEVSLERARIKFRLLPLLWGSHSLHCSIRAGQGILEGSLAWGGDETKLDFKLERVDPSLSRVAFPIGLPLQGQMNGHVVLELSASDPLKNSGKVELDIPDLRLEEGTASGFPFPALVLAKEGKEKSRIEIAVERGNWEVRSLKLTGGDLEVQADGKVYAARRLENYRLSLRGDFQTLQKLPFLSLVEDQKANGKFPFTITGRLAKPSIRIGNFKVPI